MTFFCVSLLFFCFYIIITITSAYLWKKASDESIKSNLPELVDFKRVSVIVIGRNESDNIANCLLSISHNDYPTSHYEIIYVDDHSQDGTLGIAKGLEIDNLRILRLEDYDLSDFFGKFKKAGQYHSIKEAKGDYILQTDADCVVPSTWIRTKVEALDRADLCTGMIKLKGPDTFLSKWQIFDNIGTMILTHAGIRTTRWYSANAANLAFRKNVYLKYYTDMEMNDHASGDDIFLINWANNNDFDARFLQSENSSVSTAAESSLSDLFQQRLRWATKTSSYDANGLKWLMGSLFFFHLAMIISLALLIVGVKGFKMIFLLLLCAKWIGDTIVIMTASTYFNVSYNLLLSPLYSIAHMLYVVIVGLAGLLSKKYTWKGRRVQ